MLDMEKDEQHIAEASKLPNNLINTPTTKLQQGLDIMSVIKLALMAAIQQLLIFTANTVGWIIL